MTYDEFNTLLRDRLPRDVASELIESRHIRPHSYAAVARFARWFTSGIEIGRDAGWSTLMFLMLNPDAVLDSIDIVDRPCAHAAVKALGLESRVRLHVADSQAESTPYLLGHDYEYALIDGDHHYEPTRRDWDLVRGRMRRGGVVFFDNIDNNESGAVWRSIQQHKEKFHTGFGAVYF